MSEHRSEAQERSDQTSTAPCEAGQPPEAVTR